MPIYEYSCKLCGYELEQLQSIREAPLVDCPSCMEPGLFKKLSVAAFHLKGTGWYETDFKNKDSQKTAKSKDRDAESESATTGNGEQKSESESSTSKTAASESSTKHKNADSGASTSAST